jgi:hypothetical protein
VSVAVAHTDLVAIVQLHLGDAHAVDARAVGGIEIAQFVAVGFEDEHRMVMRHGAVLHANQVVQPAPDRHAFLHEVKNFPLQLTRHDMQFRHSVVSVYD